MQTDTQTNIPRGREGKTENLPPPITTTDLQNLGPDAQHAEVHLGEPIVADATTPRGEFELHHLTTCSTDEPSKGDTIDTDSPVEYPSREKREARPSFEYAPIHDLHRTSTGRTIDKGGKTGLFQRVKAWFKGDSGALAKERADKMFQEKVWADPAPFRFQLGQLCSLIDPENVEELQAMGGVDGLLAGLGSSPDKGISADGEPVESEKHNGTIADRERVYGRSVLPERKSKSLLMLMWLALMDRMLILLIVAAIVSLALGFYTDFGRPREKVPCEESTAGPGQCWAPQVDWVEGVAILVAVLIVDLVGSLNDWQKERQFRTLDAKKEARDVTVLRNGTKHQIDVHKVLVGDVVSFEPGEVVAFDGVVLRGHNIKCDESSITGESDMISKLPYHDYINEMENTKAPLKHKSCFMVSGSKVLEGMGDFVVTAVGPMSFNGKLMMSLQDEPENTPLQTKLNYLAELIAKLGTSAGVVLFVALMIRFFVTLGKDLHDSTPHLTKEQSSQYAQRFINILIISVTIIVVAVPEGLPLAVTLALAFATRRMSNNNLLVRVLGSCETMANATCICTDKTGTLTQNKMNVVAGCVGKNCKFQDRIKFEVQNAETEEGMVDMEAMSAQLPAPIRSLFAESICINSTAFIPEADDPIESEEDALAKPWYKKLFPCRASKSEKDETQTSSSFVGSKTETALLGMVCNLQWGDYATMRNNAEVVQMIPFGSKRKSMGVVIKTPTGYRFLLKGASEVLLSHSASLVSLEAPEGGIATEPLDETARQDMNALIISYASRSLRTISLCYRDFPAWPPPHAPTNSEGEVDYEYLAQDLTLLAVTAIEDPLRKGVTDAVRACAHAGVQVKMCTGDNIVTARSIAAQCGIYGPNGIVMEGPAFRRLNDEDLAKVAPRLQVLARSSPDDKKRLTEKLKSMGEIVAVTGDGTNDGPALKAANVGFSMGIAGSEVAKEASDIILLDDNFASIVNAIVWGRCVNDAVRKFLQFQFTVNIVAVVVTFVSAVASENEDSVLTAVQLLWLNLIMDTLAALALATDPADMASLDRKPDRSTAPLLNTEMWKQVVVQSIYQIVLVLVLNFRGYDILNMSHENDVERRNDALELGTLIFNVFVWCQLFNQVNARRLDRGLNIFHNIHRNIWFILIILVEVGAQVLIIFKGGAVFSTVQINGRDWGISIVAGFISWPLGVLTRLLPTEPIERLLVRLKLMPDPHALPTVSHEAENARAMHRDDYSDWNEPAVGELAKQLGAFSSIRGGRLRASNLVLKSSKRRLRDQNIHPQSLLAIVPAFIGASVGGGWRPFKSNAGASQQGDNLPTVSARLLFSEGKLQFHPDTSPDDPFLLELKGPQPNP